jgi:hypothetical protein
MVFAPLIILYGVMGCTPRKTVQDLDLSDYAGWERTTQVPLNFPIPGHESNYRRIFMNKVGIDYRKAMGAAFSSGQVMEYPDGTIVVKEIYGGLDDPAPGEEPITLDIMVKDKAAIDTLGGWRWLIGDPKNGNEMVMSGDFCANCHNGANEKHPYGDKNTGNAFRDFLFY